MRTKGTYLSARYHRIKSRRGHAKATIATGHKILTAAYHVLNQGVPYNELGEEFFYRRDTENTERYRRRLVTPTRTPRPQSHPRTPPGGRLTQTLPRSRTPFSIQRSAGVPFEYREYAGLREK